MSEHPASNAAPGPNLGHAETPVAFVNAIVHAYARRELNPAGMLKQAQITPTILEKPQARVTALQFELASAAAMRELDDEALGWFERRLPWGSYGMLVRASLTAPTLGVALKRWCRHHNLLTGSIQLSVSEKDGVASLNLEELTDLGVLREFCIVSVLRNALGVACWLSDSRIALQRTTLRYAPPLHKDSYRVLFDGPCSFDAEANSLQFDALYLGLPVRRDEAALQRMLERALLLTVRPYRRDRLLVEKTRQLLRQDAAVLRSADALAERLNLSVRSLHRQLHEEDSSLQAIKDAVRRELALELLLRSQRPIKQIAERVGFQNEKSFLRAFKSWTGQTADAVRQTAMQSLSPATSQDRARIARPRAPRTA
ncbi:AraC family transcriptional regulator [Rhodoferax sp. GW822-FHT02A01]|uniref:AraC family transcriptional regulator n=1 Tax=Rhodoferax sp. GW822-FHT02A01 TaxID=3141537 RepID=UPI00315C8341